MMLETLPLDVHSVIWTYRSCEFSTLGKDGTPITWPVVTRYRPDIARFILTTSIAFPQKAFNIRRDPRVSLLFSDPTGSGLDNPPAVLVQGDAIAPDDVVTGATGFEDYWLEGVFKRQPFSRLLSSTAVMRSLMDWYYMRILIFVTPRVITWWPNGDFTQPSRKIEAQNEDMG